MSDHEPSVRYAGFSPRLAANLLDAVFVIPLIVLWQWGIRHFRLYQVGHAILTTLIGIVSEVVCVKRWGGSPGKLIMGLRIRDVEGRPVGYGRAVARYLPTILLWAPYAVGISLALTGMTDAEYALIDKKHFFRALEPMMPLWVRWPRTADQAWIWSELLVMLTNSKRRALHDFVAGTVVIHKRRSALDSGANPSLGTIPQATVSRQV